MHLLRLPILLVALASVWFALPNDANAGLGSTIAVGDIWFCDPSYAGGVCPTTVNVGDTVAWDFSGASLPHTTTECGASCDSPTASPLWDSGVVAGGGGPFQYTFTTAGTFLYYCEVHPLGQRGSITVQAGGVTPEATPTEPSPGGATATPTATGPGGGVAGTATPAATAVGTVVRAVPATGQGPSGGSNAWWPALLLLPAAGAGLGLLALRRVAR